MSKDVPDATVADSLHNEVINRLRNNYLDLAAKEAIWSARYGSSHLAAVNLRTQMAELRRSILDELGRIQQGFAEKAQGAEKAAKWKGATDAYLRVIREHPASEEAPFAINGISVQWALTQDTTASIQALAEVKQPYTSYVLRADDFKFIQPRLTKAAPGAKKPAPKKKDTKSAPVLPPLTYQEMVAADFLGYGSVWEFIAERFHCDEAFLRERNPRVKENPAVGTVFEEYVDQHGVGEIADIFSKGVKIEVGDMLPSKVYAERLKRVPKAWEKAFEVNAGDSEAMRASCVEFVLAGLHATDRISRSTKHGRITYET